MTTQVVLPDQSIPDEERLELLYGRRDRLKSEYYDITQRLSVNGREIC